MCYLHSALSKFKYFHCFFMRIISLTRPFPFSPSVPKQPPLPSGPSHLQHGPVSEFIFVLIFFVLYVLKIHGIYKGVSNVLD